MRHLLPFLFPAWMIVYPLIAYSVGRSNGELPTETEWNSTTHSSGPWAGEFLVFFLISFLYGFILSITMVVISSLKYDRSRLIIWSIGSGALILTTGISFYKFSYLME